MKQNAFQRTGFVVLAFFLAAAGSVLGESRYVRYRLASPAADTIASLHIVAHNLDAAQGINQWWGQPLPGFVSKRGLYVPPGEWSDWRKLPNPPVWGTITLAFRGAEPVNAVNADIEVATAPDEGAVVRRMTIANPAGDSVGFILPPDLLTYPAWLETLPETFARRRKVAEACAVPAGRRPRLLTFAPSSVSGHDSVPGSREYEAETVRLLGFNTLDFAAWPEELPDIPFRATHGVGPKEGPQGRPAPVYAIMIDEPGWSTGFTPVWNRTGQEGFHRYLAERSVAPADLGAASLDAVTHLVRSAPPAADAPIETRRLWYWSCRYTYHACAQGFRAHTDELEANLPGTLGTVNYPTHSVTLSAGMIAGHGPDYFAVGRAEALTMHWAEDWLFARLSSWGNGLYQKVSFLAELLRAAARYHPEPRPPLGFHPICIGYDPFGEGTDPTVALRVNLLLGRGVKHLSFFNYGPTHMATVDYSADHAPLMRGIADAAGMVGDPEIEPLLAAGEPVPAETCLLYGTAAEYWQTLNGADANNQEKMHTYAALTQWQIPVEILDAFDLERFIANYKAAYFIDWNIERRSAQALRQWVEAGGVLCLWPKAASLDEFNSPLELFPETEGTHAVGRGRIVRWADAPGQAWWERTRELSVAVGSDWPSHFDEHQRRRLAVPALDLARVSRPVEVGFPDIVANALVSEKGVAIPLVNLRGTFAEGGTRYLNLPVRWREGKDIVSARSSRHGPLPLRRGSDGSVGVVMPLDSTDILVFLRAGDSPALNPATQTTGPADAN